MNDYNTMIYKFNLLKTRLAKLKAIITSNTLQISLLRNTIFNLKGLGSTH